MIKALETSFFFWFANIIFAHIKIWHIFLVFTLWLYNLICTHIIFGYTNSTDWLKRAWLKSNHSKLIGRYDRIIFITSEKNQTISVFIWNSGFTNKIGILI